MDLPRDIVAISKEKLSLDSIIQSVVSPSCGAVSTFLGTTRDNFENKKVLKLEYEAYDEMAVKEMKKICKEARSKWNVGHIAIHHRVGEVPIMETSVAIAVSAPHRQEALESVAFIINTLKARVPIWKKEIYENEEPEWKENAECPWSKSKETNSVERDESDLDEEKNAAVDLNQVQIKADNVELNRRIESFISRKRQQVNTVNVQEFCNHRDLSEDTEASCARVDAILIRRKDSKSHVKVHRVLNSRGPQTMDPLMLFAESGKSSSKDSFENSEYPALEERLNITEQYLSISKPVPRDIYERLKNIEDRVLHLESISPEYKEFWIPENADSSTNLRRRVRKRTFSTAELDDKLVELENRYVKKIK